MGRGDYECMALCNDKAFRFIRKTQPCDPRSGVPTVWRHGHLCDLDFKVKDLGSTAGAV